MYAIYGLTYGGFRFIGICTKTEENAWNYINKKFGRKINGKKVVENPNAWEIKKLENF